MNNETQNDGWTITDVMTEEWEQENDWKAETQNDGWTITDVMTEEWEQENDWKAETQVRVQCPTCNETNVVTVDSGRYQAWRNGMTIQDAFPGMHPATRELLITGSCKCHARIWKE